MKIKMGMRVVWKPEWRDRGDDNYTFVAITDEAEDGYFRVSTVENTLFIRPWSSARSRMVESASPLLPVVSFRLLAVDRRGVGIEMRRTIGDATLSVRVETVSRSDFRRAFGKSVKDCAVGALIREPVVAFPEDASAKESA